VAKVLFALGSDGYMTEPMNLMDLSALAKRLGWETGLVVLERDDLLDAVKRQKPDVVAFSAITGSHQLLIAENDRLKKAKPHVKTVIGGPHATFNPRSNLEHPFDAVGVGECDEAWPELLSAWEAGRSTDGIQNIVTRENADRVLKRSLVGGSGWLIAPEHLRPRLSALDDLPYLDRDLIYENTAFRTRYKRSAMAGRGCPFRCTYCFEHAWNHMYEGKGRILQRQSVSRLCAELAELKRRWDTRFLKFYDDVFPVFPSKTDQKWLEEFAETYPREVGLPFHCLIRAEQASEPVLRLLKQAGIASMTMSIESGNPFIRDYVLRRDMSTEELEEAFHRCVELRIPTFANTILAIPAPVRPAIDAPDFDKRVDRILAIVNEVNLRRLPKGKRHLRDVINEIRATKRYPREAIYRALGEAGVRDNAIAYDIESVLVNVDLRASFGEFPMFFPYPGTDLCDYAINHGFFDGNFDRLHASYQTDSPLECFTAEEKHRQKNLALLGTAVLVLSGSYNPFIRAISKPVARFVVNVLTPLPLAKLYLQLYSWSKNYMNARRIITMRMSVKDRIQNFWDNAVLDRFKQFGQGRATPFRRRRTDQPGGQTLGGPPPR
jgi:hypothetical protein